MNPKERVKAAINKQPVDKTPLGLYFADHDIISKVIGRKTILRNKPEWQRAMWEGRRDEAVDAAKQDIVDFYRKLDCVDLVTTKEAVRVPPKGHTPENPPRRIDANTYRDDARKGVWKLEPGANDVMFFPDDTSFKEHQVEEYASRELPPVPDPSEFELMDYLAEQLGDERYMMLGNFECVSYTPLDGTVNALMTMALYPEVMQACNAQLLFQQNAVDQYTIRPWADGILIERDMAGTNGPLMSPDMFREQCLPYLKARLQHMRKFCQQVVMHNCGNTLPLLDLFIEAGIDGYQSIQTTSAMSISALRKKSNDRLSVWGAVPLEVLIEGTPDDVRKTVRSCFEEADGFPGFILGPSHSIAYGTKYENFMALLDEFVRQRDRF